MIGLLEYNEGDGSLHLNRSRGHLTFEYEPFTNGYQPVCMMDDELNIDEDFLVFRFAHAHKGITYDEFFKLVNAFLEGRFPEKRDFWEVDVKELKEAYGIR